MRKTLYLTGNKDILFCFRFFYSFNIAWFLNNILLQSKISRKVHSESIWTEWSPTNEFFFGIISSARFHIMNIFICCWLFFPPQKMSASTNNEFTPSPPLWIQRMAIIRARGIAGGVVYWRSSLVLLLIRDPFVHWSTAGKCKGSFFKVRRIPCSNPWKRIERSPKLLRCAGRKAPASGERPTGWRRWRHSKS